MMYYLMVLGVCLVGLSVCILFIPMFQCIDTNLLILAEHSRNIFLTDFACILSYIGGMPGVLLLVSGLILFLYKKDQQQSIKFLIFGFLSSSLFGWLLKFAAQRPRPNLVSHVVTSYGTSFPSVHSLYAASLACLALYTLRFIPSKQPFIVFLVIIWAFVMGVSRIYLGVHYPSDVLAGWGFGCIWISLLWIISNLQGNKIQ